jgi:hypothetical protein
VAPSKYQGGAISSRTFPKILFDLRQLLFHLGVSMRQRGLLNTSFPLHAGPQGSRRSKRHRKTEFRQQLTLVFCAVEKAVLYSISFVRVLTGTL